MTSLVGKCCCKFSEGRAVSDAPDVPLISLGGREATRADVAEAAAAAKRGLKRLRRLRQDCEALELQVGSAMAMMPGEEGQVALAAVSARLTDLEHLLRAALATSEEMQGRASGAGSRAWRQHHHRRIHEVLPCVAREGEGSWRPGKLVLSSTGLSFDPYGSEEGGTVAPMRHVAWSDVEMVEERQPTSAAGGSALFEADVRLCGPPGRLRVQSSAPTAARRLRQIWGATREGSESTRSDSSLAPSTVTQVEPEGVPQLMSELHGSGGELTAETASVFKTTLVPSQASAAGGSRPLALVRQQLLKTGDDCAVARLWRGRGVTEMMAATDWEPLGSVAGASLTSGPLIRHIHFWLPLKPMPMAPARTRMSIVYILTGDGAGAGPLTMSEMSRSLDVPYGDRFVVQSTHIFRSAPAAAAEEVGSEEALEVDNKVGVKWSSGCMVKAIVERQSRSEAVEASTELVRYIAEDLAFGLGGAAA